jgi:hypothetical protein
LELWDNALDDAAAGYLARQSDFRNLQSLNLRENRIGYAGASSLINRPGLPGLSELNLEKNRVSAEEKTALKAMAQGKRLRLVI